MDWRRSLNVQLVLLAVLMLQHATSVVAAPANTTAASDYDALVAFMSSFTQGQQVAEGIVLAGWNPDVDPCSGSWPGVMCSCRDLPRMLAPSCNSSINTTRGLRVRGLDLGPMTRADMRKLAGTIHAAVGSLSELVYLDLSDNMLTGMLPDTVENLKQLQWLILDHNQLTGTLPAYLGALPDLRRALLQDNQFAGAVPMAMCSGSSTYDFTNNRGLCGQLPKCFYTGSRVYSVGGTYLTATGLASGSQIGGGCDDTVPDCDPDIGCVVWTPKYWTSVSIVAFNFTGFIDYESSIARYEWAIGTKPLLDNVVPFTNVTATKLLKDIKYAGGTKKMFVTPVVHNLTSVSLLEGQPYYVTIIAYNGAGPPMNTSASSVVVYVDTSGPSPAAVYNTYDFQQASTTRLVHSLQASWDNFTDPHSGVASYSVQFFQQVRNAKNGTVEMMQITEPIQVDQANRVQIRTSPLKNGIMYLAKVTATNGAGLSTVVSGVPIMVQRDLSAGVAPGTAALIVVMCSLGFCAIGAVLSVAIVKRKNDSDMAREREKQLESKQLKQLMQALVNCDQSTRSDLTRHGSVSDQNRRAPGEQEEIAFVFTDIESSTELSSLDPEAFKAIQEIHDDIMREGIARYHGYEIITEGDSFQIAFDHCHEAVGFCTDVQYKLLEQVWPRHILKLAPCAVKYGKDSEVVFAGPRVRMGIHFARKGTVAVKVHNVTRHKVYAGPAVKIAQDVSDAANGGQILMTEDAVAEVTKHMAKANFPVIRMAGLFKLDVVEQPLYLFSVTEVVGKPLRRHEHLQELRKIKQQWPQPKEALPLTLLYNINLPPLPNEQSNTLAFVVLRLATYPKAKQPHGMPSSIKHKLEEVFATQAQQFKGYLFQMYDNAASKGFWSVVFQTSMDALRFTHAAQLMLNHSMWPDTANEYYGETVPGPDGRFVFHGPRICMAIHESGDYYASEDAAVDTSCPRKVMSFAGPGVTLPLILTLAGRGGQVILSEKAWDAVKVTIMKHPGAHSVVSLGTHVLSDEYSTPMLLMEVMPSLLAKRVFNKLITKQQQEPGYREAPDVKDPMTVVFAKVQKPRYVQQLEKGTSQQNVNDKVVVAVLEACQAAVTMYTATARRLLRKYDGYECKEPESGKFTIVFRFLPNAIKWACHLQEELLYLPWPQIILNCDGCREEVLQESETSTTAHLVNRGLKVKIGMAYGMVSSKKALNTGRADYFGVLPNGAARVMALADAGQVLVEAMCPPLENDDDKNSMPLLMANKETQLRLLAVPGSNLAYHKELEGRGLLKKDFDADKVIVKALGYYKLRGLEHPRLIFEACTVRTQPRVFKPTDKPIAGPTDYNFAGVNSSTSSKRSVKSMFGRLSKKQQTGPPSCNGSPAAAKQQQQILEQQSLKSKLASSGCSVSGQVVGSAAASTEGSRDDTPVPSTGTALTSRCTDYTELHALPPRSSSVATCDGDGNLRPSAASASGAMFGPQPEHRRALSMCSTATQSVHHAGFQEPPTGVHRSRSDTSQATKHPTSEHPAAVRHWQMQPQQQLQLQQSSSLCRGGSATSSGLADYTGHPNLPPIRTALSPPDNDNWTETPTSMEGSPMSPFLDSCNCSPMTCSFPAAAAATAVQQLRMEQHMQEYQRLNTMRLSGAGQSDNTSAGGQQYTPTSLYSSLDTSGLESPSMHAQVVLQQQQQLQQSMNNFQRSVMSSNQGTDSVSSSLDGPAGRLKGIFAAGSGSIQQTPGALRSLGNAAEAIMKPAKALLDTVRRRSSAHSHTAAGTADAGGTAPEDASSDSGNEGEIEQAAAVRQRLGMTGSKCAIVTSLPPTPGSAGSNGAQGQLPSPLSGQFHADYAQAFVNQRRNSVTSIQQSYNMRGPTYSGNGSYSAHASPMQSIMGEPGDITAEYAYAASSYSPQHFQRGAFSEWQVPNMGTAQQIWQQQQPSIQATGGDVLLFEPSLNGGALSLLTAGSPPRAAADASAISAEFSLGMSGRPCAAALLDRSSPDVQAAVAGQHHDMPHSISSDMSASQALLWQQYQQQMITAGYVQHHIHAQQQQFNVQQATFSQQLHELHNSGLLQQQLQQLEQQHQQDAAAVQPDAATEAYERAAVCSPDVIDRLAQREDSASLVVRAASASGTPFTMRELPQRLLLVRMSPEALAAAQTVGRTANNISYKEHNMVQSSNSSSELEQQMQRAREEGRIVYNPVSYCESVRAQEQSLKAKTYDISDFELEAEASGMFHSVSSSTPADLHGNPVQQQHAQQAIFKQHQQLPQVLVPEGRFHSQTMPRPSPLGNTLRSSSVTSIGSLKGVAALTADPSCVRASFDQPISTRAAAALQQGMCSAAEDGSSNCSSPRLELSSSQVCCSESPRSLNSTPRSFSQGGLRKSSASYTSAGATVAALAASSSASGALGSVAAVHMGVVDTGHHGPRRNDMAPAAAAACHEKDGGQGIVVGNHLLPVGVTGSIAATCAPLHNTASSIPTPGVLDGIPEAQGMEGRASDLADYSQPPTP